MTDRSTDARGRNLVVCLDGTTNEPETGVTNVARMFDVASKHDNQLVYYEPGVGTMGSRAAVYRLGRAMTRAARPLSGMNRNVASNSKTSKRPTHGLLTITGRVT
jgi:uncharacterized protein (DUF2235 family)